MLPLLLRPSSSVAWFGSTVVRLGAPLGWENVKEGPGGGCLPLWLGFSKTRGPARPGSTTAKVTFQNEITGEYLFYNLSYEMQPPEVQGTIHREGPVRQYVSSTISITNPLETEVKLESRCSPRLQLPGSRTGASCRTRT